MIWEKRLKRTDMIIFLFMHMFSEDNKNRKIYKYNKKYLADKLNMSIHTIQKSVEALKKSELINYIYRFRVGENNNTDSNTIETEDWEEYVRLRKETGMRPLGAYYILADIGVRGRFIN